MEAKSFLLKKCRKYRDTVPFRKRLYERDKIAHFSAHKTFKNNRGQSLSLVQAILAILEKRRLAPEEEEEVGRVSLVSKRDIEDILEYMDQELEEEEEELETEILLDSFFRR